MPALIKFFPFADNAKTYEVKTVVDYLRIQLPPDAIFTWSLLRQFPLNILTCVILHLGRGNINFSYHINDIQLSNEDMVFNFGSTISRDLIDKILVKYHKCLFVIKKCFKYKNPNIDKLLFTTCMRSILEYGSLLWSPYSQHEIDVFECNYIEPLSQITSLIYPFLDLISLNIVECV